MAAFKKMYNGIRGYMNHFVKKFSLSSLALGGLFLAACGSDDGSSSIDMEDSFDIVLSKAHYDYNSDDSTLTVTYPACKEGNLGNFVWREENPDSVVKYKAYRDRDDAVRFDVGKTEPSRFAFDGGKFPIGFWAAPTEKKGGKFQRGLRFSKKDEVASVVHYSGSCYAQDFKANMFLNNSSIAMTEQELVKFYQMFQPSDKQEVKNGAEVLTNIHDEECDRLTMYDDLVEIEVDELKEYAGELTVSYESDECPVNFAIRYAVDEDDCKAAYDEFLADKSAEKFNFADYSMKVEYDEYCIAQLVLNLKKDQNISLKKTSSLKSDSKEFAKGIARLILSGLK